MKYQYISRMFLSYPQYLLICLKHFHIAAANMNCFNLFNIYSFIPSRFNKNAYSKAVSLYFSNLPDEPLCPADIFI